MAEVKILQIGYTSADTKGSAEEETTSPTITLIRDGKEIIVVDPGVLKSQDLMASFLKTEGINIDDVSYVFLTHSHPDHHMNAGMFSKAKKLEFYGIWDNNKVKDWDPNFSENIEIIKTPGHSDDSLTYLVNTEKGKIAICGDVFWKENYPAKDNYANNLERLTESRQKVLALSDYVIPGHGDIFKAKK